MGTVIKNNMSAINTLNVLNKNNSALQKTMLRLSSGQKINSGGDDAAGLIISEKMRDRIRADQQANRNVQSGIVMLNVAENGVGNISEILQTMHEKALQARNNAMSTTTADVSSISKELNALKDQISTIISTTKYNGRTLLGSNAAGSLYLQIGAEAGDTIQALSYRPLSTGLSVLSIQMSTFSAIGSTITNIATALSQVLSVQGDIAKVQSRLGYQSDNLVAESTGLQEAESIIRDTDMSADMANFAKWNVLSQSSQLMLAQAGQNAYSVLNLLQQ